MKDSRIHHASQIGVAWRDLTQSASPYGQSAGWGSWFSGWGWALTGGFISFPESFRKADFMFSSVSGLFLLIFRKLFGTPRMCWAPLKQIIRMIILMMIIIMWIKQRHQQTNEHELTWTNHHKTTTTTTTTTTDNTNTNTNTDTNTNTTNNIVYLLLLLLLLSLILIINNTYVDPPPHPPPSYYYYDC